MLDFFATKNVEVLSHPNIYCRTFLYTGKEAIVYIK